MKKRQQKIVLVGGCFDILHYGHLVFLKKAKEAGDKLIVALEPDEFIVKIKKRQSVHNQQQRAEILSSLEFVDKVIMLPFLDKDGYGQLVNKIKPSVIAVTADDPYIENKKEMAKKVGGTVKVVTKLLTKYSTRKIIDKI